MLNAITAVAGVRVGSVDHHRLASGVTVVLFDEPAVASVSVGGGAPGLRDTALLEPGMSVGHVDALVLSGGSAFGLDAPGGAQAVLRARGRGLAVGGTRVPIVPGAVLFDLGNGGDKAWGETPAYWHLGRDATLAALAASDGGAVACGSVGAGLGATTADLKGGLGTAATAVAAGSRTFTVAALVAVNALGSAVIGDGPHFWAAPYERDGEFGGLGWPAAVGADDLRTRVKGLVPANTTIAVVATDAALTKAEAKRIAVMAQDGLARALRPSHAAMDGDTVFAAATARTATAPDAAALLQIGAAAADCLARAIARAVFEAASLPFAGAQPSWRQRFGAAATAPP